MYGLPFYLLWASVRRPSYKLYNSCRTMCITFAIQYVPRTAYTDQKYIMIAALARNVSILSLKGKAHYVD